MSEIDQNSRQVGLGYVHGSTGTVLPFAVNASNELLIEIIPVGAPLGALAASGIHLDANSRQVAAAVTDDANETITPLTVDEISGLPLIRVELI